MGPTAEQSAPSAEAPRPPAPSPPLPMPIILLGVAVALMTVIVLGVWVTGVLGEAAKPECVLNGFGIGSCTFTNDGIVPWSACGRVVLRSRESRGQAASSPVCSGLLWRSSAVVSVSVPNMRQTCPTNAEQSWPDSCSLSFDVAK